MSASWADSLYDILHVQNLESLRNFYLWDFFVLQAVGMPTLGASDVHVLAVGMMMVVTLMDFTCMAVAASVLVIEVLLAT